MKKKRHHHFVWRNYLQSWALNGMIACLRKGRIFVSNIKGVGQEKDFYKLKELTLDDIEFIKKLAIATAPKHLQKGHENLVKQFDLVFQLRNWAKSKEINDQGVSDLLDIAIHNLEEDLHVGIENSAIKYIASLLQENIEFYKTDEGYLDFIYFLCVQYWRTEKTKRAFLEVVSKPIHQNKVVNFERIWNVLSHIFATNMAWSLYANRKKFKMVLLKNETTKEFITGDQPVINTCAVIGVSKVSPDDIELYYPLSPVSAVLITEKEKYEGIEKKVLNEKEVGYYNDLIVRSSYSQVYARSKYVLEEYVNN